MEASSKGHCETVEVLLKHKADLNATEKVSLVEGCESALIGLECNGLGVEVWEGWV